MNDVKRAAGEAALRYVRRGGIVGLGTGSTVRYAIEAIGRRRDLKVRGIPTSRATERLARRCGIPLLELGEEPIDVTIDGADEVDPRLNLIKGLGGALTREKVVAAGAKRFVVVVDESKLVRRLGSKVPVPVEVIPFGWRATTKHLSRLGARPVLRRVRGLPYRTDNGNWILDCRFATIRDPPKLQAAIDAIPGVVESGLFLGMTDIVLVGSEDGVRTLRRAR